MSDRLFPSSAERRFLVPARYYAGRGKQAGAIAESYRALSSRPSDPVLRPYCAALIDDAKTGVPTPWWRIMRAEALAPA